MKSVYTQIILSKGYVKLNPKHTSETLKDKTCRKIIELKKNVKLYVS